MTTKAYILCHRKLLPLMRQHPVNNNNCIRCWNSYIIMGSSFPSLPHCYIHLTNQLLKSGSVWNWSSDCQQAFSQAKKLLSLAAVLAHYNPSFLLYLATDKSAYGRGAVVSHIFPDGTEQPIAFTTQTLSNSEKRYAQLEKENLSSMFGVYTKVSSLFIC